MDLNDTLNSVAYKTWKRNLHKRIRTRNYYWLRRSLKSLFFKDLLMTKPFEIYPIVLATLDLEIISMFFELTAQYEQPFDDYHMRVYPDEDGGFRHIDRDPRYYKLEYDYGRKYYYEPYKVPMPLRAHIEFHRDWFTSAEVFRLLFDNSSEFDKYNQNENIEETSIRHILRSNYMNRYLVGFASINDAKSMLRQIDITQNIWDGLFINNKMELIRFLINELSEPVNITQNTWDCLIKDNNIKRIKFLVEELSIPIDIEDLYVEDKYDVNDIPILKDAWYPEREELFKYVMNSNPNIARNLCSRWMVMHYCDSRAFEKLAEFIPVDCLTVAFLVNLKTDNLLYLINNITIPVDILARFTTQWLSYLHIVRKKDKWPVFRRNHFKVLCRLLDLIPLDVKIRLPKVKKPEKLFRYYESYFMKKHGVIDYNRTRSVTTPEEEQALEESKKYLSRIGRVSE